MHGADRLGDGLGVRSQLDRLLRSAGRTPAAQATGMGSATARRANSARAVARSRLWETRTRPTMRYANVAAAARTSR